MPFFIALKSQTTAKSNIHAFFFYSPYPGILKKSSSSVDYLSRESTPDSGLGRIYDSVSGGGGGSNR